MCVSKDSDGKRCIKNACETAAVEITLPFTNMDVEAKKTFD